METKRTLLIRDHGLEFNVVIEALPIDETIIHNYLISFYDNRYRFTEHGQFISSYYLKTFMGIEPGRGINLQGGIDCWYLTDVAVNKIKDFVISNKINVTSNHKFVN